MEDETIFLNQKAKEHYRMLRSDGLVLHKGGLSPLAETNKFNIKYYEKPAISCSSSLTDEAIL